MADTNNNSNNFDRNAGAMLSLFGSAGSLLGQQITNDRNEVINRQNNALQIALAQNADARNMILWNMTNQYNSPVQQRRRLLEAGLNPGLMYGGIDNTAGAPSDSNVPETTASQREFNANAMVGAFNNAGDILQENNDINTRIKTAQAESIELDNDIKKERRPIELQNLIKEGERIAAQTAEQQAETIRKNIRLLSDMREAEDKHNKTLAEIKGRQLENTNLENLIDEWNRLKPFREAVARHKASIMASNARIAKDLADLSSQQMAAIDMANIELAEEEWLIDTYYGHYLKRQTGEHWYSTNKYYKKNTLSPAMWVKSLDPNTRYNLLHPQKEGDYYKVSGFGHLKMPDDFEPFEDAYKNNKRYQNLYSRKADRSKLTPITQGYIDIETDDGDRISNFGLKGVSTK